MTESINQSKNSLILFFVLTFILSWIIWLPGVLVTFGILTVTFDDIVYVILNVVGGSCPTIVGLFLFYRDGGMDKIKEVLRSGISPWRISKVWWIPLIFLIPVLNATALLLGVLSGSPMPELLMLQQWYLIPILFIAGFIPFSNAFREEFGWRGYAIDGLQTRWNALTTSIIIGLAWGLWHLPLRYFPGAMEVYANNPIWVFMLNAITISIMMTWFYNNNKGSIFTAVVFHVMINITPSIFPFGQTELGIYYNMILYLVAAVLIVLFFGYKTMRRESNQAI